MFTNVTSSLDEEVIYLPDYQFAKWCEQQFSINRGVYNTIDLKLYEQGIKQIEVRRKAIIHFLSRTLREEEASKFYRFGHGNLASALNDFVHSVSAAK